MRGARVVLFDDDGVRAPIVAIWLRQMGHDAHVLVAGPDDAAGGLDSGLALPAASAPVLPELEEIDATSLATALDGNRAALLDLRSSSAFREAHVAGARWTIRPELAAEVADETRPLVLLADEAALARLSLLELPEWQRRQARLLRGGFPAWRDAGLPVSRNPQALDDERCIDFLFFAHDRHAGNKAAARQYLAWETGLLAQLHEQELASLRPLAPAISGAGDDLRTRLVHAARPGGGSGAHPVNPPVTRLSTVLFDSLEQMNDIRGRRDGERLLSYGARGNPTAFALEDLISELEGGYRTRLFPTGLAATAHTFLAYLRPGDHLLITDGVYSPVRRLVREFLAPFGIEATFFPADGRGLERHLRANTRMVYGEVPSSLLFELCDLPAIAALCRSRGILLAVDNTWGAGYLYRPLALGADIAVTAPTKYLGGHSDVVMGGVCTREEVWQPLARMSDGFGITVSPDDAYLVLRGARTLAARLDAHQRHALRIAHWLQARPEVARVFHPALPEHPDHALWRRDFAGANGLLTIEFAATASVDLEAFIGALRLFGLGASWGGYESLVSVADPSDRDAGWDGGALLRLHVGLESPEALIDDLARGFEAGIGQ